MLLRSSFVKALVLAAILLLFLYECRSILLHRTQRANWFQFDEFQETNTDQIFNRTLGFAGIVAVSNGPSWRIDGLIEAADYSEIDIDIPDQPAWTMDDVDAFRRRNHPDSAKRIGPGQTRCWMGHRHSLLHGLSRGWATILVLEDDADWDIAIKNQLALAAPYIRSVAAEFVFPQPSSVQHDSSQPYGNSWDMLWIGHCGDPIPSAGTRLFNDDTLPVSQKYREYTGRITLLTPEPQQRIVHKSEGPICAFAYALTSSAATKILRYTEKGVSDMITDDLRWWCQSGFLKCITVNPELFHHHKKAGQTNSEIAARQGHELGAPAQTDLTANIRYSARCNAGAKTLVISCQDMLEEDRQEGTS